MGHNGKCGGGPEGCDCAKEAGRFGRSLKGLLMEFKWRTWQKAANHGIDFTKGAYERHLDEETEYAKNGYGIPDAAEAYGILKKYGKPFRRICRIAKREGWSGSFAPYFIDRISVILKDVLMLEPASPLSFAESEWERPAEMDAGGDTVWQTNKRCPYVRRAVTHVDGGERTRIFYTSAVVWTEDVQDSNCRTSMEVSFLSSDVEGYSSEWELDLEGMGYWSGGFCGFVPKRHFVKVVRTSATDKDTDARIGGRRAEDGKRDMYRYVIRDKDKMLAELAAEHYKAYDRTQE